MAGRKRGPKVKRISMLEVDKLCKLQCLEIEIADWFSMSVETLGRRVQEKTGMKFVEYYELKKGAGRLALRRKQMQLALGGNITMLIWLGKQYLAQSDKSEVRQTSFMDLTLNMSPEEREARIKELEALGAAH